MSGQFAKLVDEIFRDFCGVSWMNSDCGIDAGILAAIRTASRLEATVVPMAMIRVTPAAAALLTTASRSEANSGKSK